MNRILHGTWKGMGDWYEGADKAPPGGIYLRRRMQIMAILVGLAALAGCASAPPYGLHGDIVVGKRAIFRHKTSKMVKLDCTECHDKLYTTIKQHEKHTMPGIKEGESCGTCHNGKRAFSVTGNCVMCHKK